MHLSTDCQEFVAHWSRIASDTLEDMSVGV